MSASAHPFSAATALTLLDVLLDYTTQTLDELHSLSDEGADVMEDVDAATLQTLQQRLQRIRAVLDVIHQWQQHGRASDRAVSSDHDHALGSSSSRSTTSAHDGARHDHSGSHAPCDPVSRAVSRLSRVYDTLTGRTTPSGTSAVSPSGTRPDSVVVLPMGQMRGLSEAVCELQGHNTQTVYRRSAKSTHSVTNTGVRAQTHSVHPSNQGGSAALATYKRPRLDSNATHAADATASAATGAVAGATTQASGVEGKSMCAESTIGQQHVVPDEWAVIHTYTTLAQEQRARRARLYSGQLAHLPHTELAMRPYAVSPAVREFIRLNAEAEQVMARHSWAIQVKTQLLRELPKLRAMVQRYHDEDEEQDDVDERQHQCQRYPHATDASMRACMSTMQDVSACGMRSYFFFDAHQGGVVRVAVQRGLLWLDVSLPLERREGWVVLRMYWNVWVSVSSTVRTEAALFASDTPSSNEGGEGREADTTASVASALRLLTEPMPPCSSSGRGDSGGSRRRRREESGVWYRVQPPHEPVMLAYLQRRFAEAGLDGGCVAANRLLCTVLMDIITYQLSALQKDVFVGPLSGVLRLEVRPGTYVACRFTPPFVPVLSCKMQPNTRAMHATNIAEEKDRPLDATGDPSRRGELFVKCSVSRGRVMVERMWGAQVHSRRTETLEQALGSVLTRAEVDERNARMRAARRTLGEGGEGACFVDPLAMVVDMESFLWQSVLSPPTGNARG